MQRARVRVPGRTQKKRQRRVRRGRAGRSGSVKTGPFIVRAALWCGQFCAKWPRPCPPPHAAFRTRCPRTVQRVRSEAHYAAAVPRLARPTSGGGPGKTCKSVALPRRAEAKPGPPHVVRIRTDTFLCPEKCPGCRVRWGRNRAKRFPQNQPSLGPDGAEERGSLARGGRVPVRRRTRRFEHAALAPCSVFAPRRTTRRQCRVWLGLHRAAGRAKKGSAPPCRAGTVACIFRQGVYNTIP